MYHSHLPLQKQVQLTLHEGDWWHGQIDVSELFESTSPLAVSVSVLRASQCSEGTVENACRFGLKLFGSAHGPFSTSHPAEAAQPGSAWVQQNGGSYAMVASACELRQAWSRGGNRNYYVSVWGWDGTNDLSLLAAPMPTIRDLYCPPPAEPAAEPAAAPAEPAEATTDPSAAAKPAKPAEATGGLPKLVLEQCSLRQGPSEDKRVLERFE